MPGSSSPSCVSTKLQRIAELSKQSPTMVLTTLNHHIDMDFLKEAYRRTRKNGAVGVDGQTASDYEQNLEENLQILLTRFKSGTYRAPPVRRVFIPKGKGGTRPIGIPTLEDKILQRAIAMVLEAVYEQSFLDCSYGFRPGRSAHQALDALWHSLMDSRGGWVIELDIKSFYDMMDGGHLRQILDKRVRDGVVRRMVDKWLKAGVMESGKLSYPTKGTPQGGVISPLLSNIYLHEVLDKWFEEVVRPRLRGRGQLIRYADDAVLIFTSEHDARKVYEVLPKRFERYGLTLHPEKTCLMRFRPPGRNDQGRKGGGSSRSFDLLGFRHFWARSLKGNWVVKRKTASDRFARSIQRFSLWCRRNRHRPVKEQHAAISRALKGHYGYYGITGNSPSLKRFRFEVVRIWRQWLNRRSQGNHMPWERYQRLIKRYPLPTVFTVHSVLSPRYVKP